MRVRLIVVGALKSREIGALEADYLARIAPRCKVEIVELRPSGITDQAARRLDEAQAVLRLIKSGEYVIALDEDGDVFNSSEFAQSLQKRMVQGEANFAVIIGGAFGLDGSVKERANLILSLSRFTFPHQLARLIFIEQLYRAFSIINREPYHK